MAFKLFEQQELLRKANCMQSQSGAEGVGGETGSLVPSGVSLQHPYGTLEHDLQTFVLASGQEWGNKREGGLPKKPKWTLESP